jgi:stage II sporulation protein E
VTRKEQFKKYALVGAKYLVLVLVFFVLAHAKIDAGISPFASAALFAAVFLPVKFWVAPLAYFLSMLMLPLEHTAVISALFVCGVGLGFLALGRNVKKLRNMVACVVAFVVSQGFAVAVAFAEREDFYKSLISVIVGAVFLICVCILIKTVKVKRAKVPWTIDQKICAAVFITVFALGLAGLENNYFSVHKMVTIYAILVGVYLFDARATLVVAVCLGLGHSFVALNLNYVAIYTLLAAIAMAFKSGKTVYSIVALVFTDIVLGVYFGAYINYNFYSILPIVVAVAFFVVTPHKWVKYFNFSANVLGGHATAKNTINRNRAGVFTRISCLAAVFAELQNIYRAMVSTETPPHEAKLFIADGVSTAVCGNCSKRGTCMREVGAVEEIRESFAELALIGVNRGNVNFLDVPQSLTMKCGKINNILSSTNSMLRDRIQRQAEAATMDTGKVLMAQLLAGLNKLMVHFADDACSSVVFDNELGDLIKEELLYKNIVASDCLIIKSGINDYTISVLVRREDSRNKAIENVISRVVRRKMQLDTIDDGDTAGFCIVTVKTAPRFQLVFGVAQLSKNFNGPCGDIYSFLKVNNEKTLMAICDGMGAGAKAEEAGLLALSLVENFYKAGFPNEMIMQSVNQLLQISKQDIFSALDLAVFNQASGEVDFIKVGASDGFIKRETSVEIVEAGSLPMGVLEEMQPKITRAVLSVGDVVVLCSDGVADAFGDRVALGNFINNLVLTSPQNFADTIMHEALNRSGRIAKDDCTIVVGKLTAR